MITNNIPGFDAIGFRIDQSDEQQFSKMLQSLWAVSEKYPSVNGQCGAISGDYFRLWTHADDNGLSHVLEANPLPGLVCQVEEYLDSGLVKAWVWEIGNSEATEPLYPVCFRSPVPWFQPQVIQNYGCTTLSLSVLSSQAEFFDNKEQLAQHPQLSSYAEESVVSTGLFTETGETPSATILVIGRILLVVKSVNQVSNDEFIALRVRTLGGEVNVALPYEAVSEDVTGKIIAVHGAASGSIPEWMPSPIESTPDLDEEIKPFILDDMETKEKIRILCSKFFKSPSFKPYFREIHATRSQRVIASFMGMFSKNYIGFTKQRGKATWLTAKKYHRACKKGTVVLARIVMANTLVLYEGKSSPALIVIAFGEGAEKAMTNARPVLARIHFGQIQNENERKLAAEIEDETYYFGKRRRLPKWLVGDVEAYAADLWIPAVAAFEDGLRSDVLVCLAEAGPKGLTAALPSKLIEKALKLHHS